jgi:hypothetical protein
MSISTSRIAACLFLIPVGIALASSRLPTQVDQKKSDQIGLVKRFELLKDQVEDLKKQSALDRVPLGAMLPYFGGGDTPPKGYVFADGVATWPDADWVPAHLRPDKAGRRVKVPDMRQY